MYIIVLYFVDGQVNQAHVTSLPLNHKGVSTYCLDFCTYYSFKQATQLVMARLVQNVCITCPFENECVLTSI